MPRSLDNQRDISGDFYVSDNLTSDSINVDNLSIDIDNFMCGEDGKYLSFGQKQRLAIARAIYQNKDIIILDECTSNLDDRSESKIIERFKNHLSDKTGIIVSHKFSSLEICNKIFEMKDGKLLER